MHAQFRNIVLGAALALALIVPSLAHADAGPRLFADSQLVVRDRFSDEIAGAGPDSSSFRACRRRVKPGRPPPNG